MPHITGKNRQHKEVAFSWKELELALTEEVAFETESEDKQDILTDTDRFEWTKCTWTGQGREETQKMETAVCSATMSNSVKPDYRIYLKKSRYYG